MNSEPTLSDIYDSIAEQIASAQTRALMGEREEALGLMHGAHLDYMRFETVLADLSDRPALPNSYRTAIAALHDQRDRAADLAVRRPARRRARQAA